MDGLISGGGGLKPGVLKWDFTVVELVRWSSDMPNEACC